MNLNRLQTLRKNKGFTIIEVGIVLALVGIALYFVISKLSQTADQNKAQNLSTDLSSVIGNAKRLYASQTSYAGVTIGALRDNAVFPPQWNVAGTITGPFTGPISVAAGTLVAANDALAITVPNIPSGVCSDIARMMVEGVNIITVAGTVVKPNNGAMDVATLGTQCSSAASVPMIFTFGRI